MSNISRARWLTGNARALTATCASVLILLSAALSGQAVTTHKKGVPPAPQLPSMPAPVTTVRSTTTSTSSSTTATPGANAYNWAAPPPILHTTTVYDGQTAAKSGLTIVAWGGGSGGVSSDIAYGKGGNSIRIVTHNLYEGARINFDPAVPLGDTSVTKNRVFQLLVRFGQAEEEDDSDTDTGMAVPTLAPAPRTYSVAGSGGRISGAEYTIDSGDRNLLRLVQAGPGYPGAGYPGAGYPGAGYPRRSRGALPGPGYPGAPGYPAVNPNAAVSSPDSAWDPPVHFFRLLFTLQDGAQAEILRPTPWPTAFDDPDTAWLSIGVPLSLLKFGDAPDSSPLASITIGGDGPATFYIGQMNLVDDDAPIICSAGPTQDVASGDDATFQARAQGGASMLSYSWDFDASDGITDEADGATVSHKFATGNKDYIVTLTVSDLDGIKKPCTSTVKVKVEE